MCLRGVITTRHYTDQRLLLPIYLWLVMDNGNHLGSLNPDFYSSDALCNTQETTLKHWSYTLIIIIIIIN